MSISFVEFFYKNAWCSNWIVHMVYCQEQMTSRSLVGFTPCARVNGTWGCPNPNCSAHENFLALSAWKALLFHSASPKLPLSSPTAPPLWSHHRQSNHSVREISSVELCACLLYFDWWTPLELWTLCATSGNRSILAFLVANFCQQTISFIRGPFLREMVSSHRQLSIFFNCFQK